MKKKLSIIAVLCVLICVGLSIIFLSNVNSYKFKEDASYYVNGDKYPVYKGSRAKLNKDKSVTLTLKGNDVLEISGLPAYFDNSNKIVLLNKMTYYKPSFDSKFEKYKLNSFTEIEYDEDTGDITFTNGTKTKTSQTGFLYDGKNSFVFFEDTIIDYNGQKEYVKPLSFIVVERDSWIQIYNKENDKFIFDQLNGFGMARNLNEGYEINMTYGKIFYGQKESIMPSNTEVLRDFFEVE